MKKILLIIFLFFCCLTVNAQERKFAGSEYLPGISYMKYDGNTHYYRNAQVIRDVDTGELAYCIEPFKLLVDNSSYSSDNYTRYGISDANWDRIKLLAYYGYGYNGHTNKKWISVTQLLIWKTLYPNYQFEWIDNVDDRNIIEPYIYEMREVNGLVNNHYTLPKLNNHYEIDINGALTLKDNNSVLRYYDIISSDFKIDKSANTMVISAGDEIKEGKIHLRRADNISDNSALFFYSSSSQNVLKRGNVTPIDFEINISVKEGKIVINKIDNSDLDIKSKDAVLDGAIFELYDNEMNLIKESVVENNQAIFNNLSYGNYFVKEKTPGTGYYLNEEVYEIEINENNMEKEITIGNSVIKSTVKITKYYGSKNDYDNNQMKTESGISFNIYDDSNNLVYEGKTNKEGIIELVLPYGNYVLKQVNSTNGYKLSDDYNFSINNDSNHSIDIVLYDFKIEVPNARISMFKFIKHLMERFFA